MPTDSQALKRDVMLARCLGVQHRKSQESGFSSVTHWRIEKGFSVSGRNSRLFKKVAATALKDPEVFSEERSRYEAAEVPFKKVESVAKESYSSSFERADVLDLNEVSLRAA